MQKATAAFTTTMAAAMTFAMVVQWRRDLSYHRRAMTDVEHTLDTTDLLCPEPLMLVRNAVREMSSGEVLHVTATDPSTTRDFSNFCRFMGHELREQRLEGPVLHYWIVKS